MNLNRFFKPFKKTTRDTRALAGGRVSVQDPFRAQNLYAVTPPERGLSAWQLKNYTKEELLNIQVDRLVKILVDIHPNIKKTFKDFISKCNKSWTYTVEPESATHIIDDFFETIEKHHGTPDGLFEKMWAGVFLRGAYFLELVLDEAGRLAIDLAVLDPITARFNRVKDPVRGEFWQLGQWQEGKWQSLEDPLVKYLAIDAAPDEPFGRSMMGAALIDAISDLSILDEFQRVLAGAGWARSDFEVVMGGTEDSYGLLDFMPPGIRGDQDREDEFYKNFLEGISDVYKNLAPNEGYAHPDFINVNMPTGAQLNQSFFASIEGLIRLLTRRTTNATSSTNLKQGETDGVDYAGKEQNKDYKELIVGEQETGSRLISNLLNWVPRVMGIKAEVEFLFETPETPEEALELAEVEKVKIENAKGLAELQGVEFDTEMTADDFDTEMDDLRSHSQDCPHCQKKRASDERAATITPDGSEYPLPSPTEIVVTLAILDDAIDWFEDHTTGYKGLLYASLMNMQAPLESVTRGNWIWNQATKRYRNSKTRKTITSNTLISLRDTFLDDIKTDIDDLTERLATGRVSIQDWTTDMRNHVRNTFDAQYMLSKGGRNAMAQADLDTLSEVINEQHRYLQDFAQEIQSGQLSIGQINQRSKLYIEAATSAHERGKASSFDIQLPEYPADGNQICGSNCRCRWEILEVKGGHDAYWLLNIAAEHCDSCRENAAKWKPLRLRS